MSMFVDLFRYRERENRRPLEDWLTECLAAVLRALSADKMATTLAALTQSAGRPRVSANTLLSYAEKKKIEIHTQYSAGEAGRPDIVVTLDDCPWMIIENKVGHHVGERTDAVGNASHQLREYARWLSERSEDCTGVTKTIVFITHLTPAPADFHGAKTDDAYRDLIRHSTSWGEVGRLLIAQTEGNDPFNHARNLAQDFYACLKEHRMSSEYPSSTDLASLEVYIERASKIDGLLDEMWEAVSELASCSGYATEKTFADSDFGCYLSQRQAKSDFGTSTLETGLWFPELGEWWEEGDAKDCSGKQIDKPDGVQVFIALNNEADEEECPVECAPEGWVRHGFCFYFFQSLSAFDVDPDKRAQGIKTLLREEVAKAKPFFAKAGLVQ